MKKRNDINIPAVLSVLPTSYLALMAEFPLRPIRGGSEYDRAAKILHRLALNEGKLDAGEDAYMEVLEAIVERYDQAHYLMNVADVSPTDAIRLLVEQAAASMAPIPCWPPAPPATR